MNIIKIIYPFITGQPKAFYLQLLVKPKSKIEQLTYSQDFIIIKTKAQPIDNEANQDVLRILSEQLEIDISSIKIIKGLQNKQKVVIINNESDAYKKLSELQCQF